MKRLLSILGTINLVGTSTTSLVACNKPQYSEDELKKEKEKNNITTKDGILEWMAPQEKLFNNVDKKWYYIVWREDKNNNWIISKYKNNIELNFSEDIQIERNLFLTKLKSYPNDLVIKNDNYYIAQWFLDKKNNYFKSVFCWKGEEQNLPVLYIDKDNNVKVNE